MSFWPTLSCLLGSVLAWPQSCLCSCAECHDLCARSSDAHALSGFQGHEETEAAVSSAASAVIVESSAASPAADSLSDVNGVFRPGWEVSQLSLFSCLQHGLKRPLIVNAFSMESSTGHSGAHANDIKLNAAWVLLRHMLCTYWILILVSYPAWDLQSQVMLSGMQENDNGLQEHVHALSGKTSR